MQLGCANELGREAPRSLPERALRALGRSIDVEMGSLGALVLGGAVWLLNVDHGALGATTAALKQGAYTFFFGGAVVRLGTVLAQRLESRIAAIVAGSVVPSAIALAATALVHSVRGTPDPVASLLPTLILAPPSFTALALRARRQLEGPRRGEVPR